MKNIYSGLLALAFASLMSITAAHADILSGSSSNSWTGCHIGVHGGHTWKDAEIVAPGLGVSVSDGATDWIGGVNAGCDVQISRLVLGFAGDYTVGNSAVNFGQPGVSYKFDNSYALIGRAGWLFTPNVLGYGLAGYTWAQTGFNMFSVPDLEGYTLGGGVEWAPPALRGFSLKIEYRYTDFGMDPFIAGIAFTDSYSQDVRVGISYRF